MWGITFGSVHIAVMNFHTKEVYNVQSVEVTIQDFIMTKKIEKWRYKYGIQAHREVNVMSYYGKIDKKSIVNILDNGLGFLKDELKDQSRSGDTNLSEFYRLEKLLYNEGSQLLSMTNKVRFEKRLNTIRKNLDKFK